jgi:apolipoprotein N-acyltransferase
MPTPGIAAKPEGMMPQLQPAPATTSAAAPAPRVGRRALLLALASGALLWLCYFPAACGWLGWVALVPLLALVRSPARQRVVYASAFAGGLLFFGPALQWMRVADPRMYFTWAGLATYCAAYLPLGVFLVRRLERRAGLPLTVAVPLVWAALEFLRAGFGGGFAWYFLGHTQHDVLPLIQVADLGGAYAVTLLVAAVNAFAFELLWAWRPFRAWCGGAGAAPRWGTAGLAWQGAAVAAALAAALGYGYWRLGQAHFTPGPRLALVQGNVPQDVRNDNTAWKAAATQYLGLARLASDFAWPAGQRPDLVVWPETSYPFDWKEEAPGRPEGATAESFRAIATDWRWTTPHVVGLNATAFAADGRRHRYNSALLLDASGGAVARYDKFHRVPFGEYVPLRDWLPFMNALAPYDFEYSVTPGVEHTRFPLAPAGGARPATFGVAICYEDTDPDVVRPYGGGDGKPPADFLLNISNDGWFKGTSEHEEHLAVARFRAVECRRSVARAVNMGVSAVIDPNGRVLAPRLLETVSPDPTSGAGLVPARVWYVGAEEEAGPGLPPARWGEFKSAPGVLLAAVPLDDRTSFYARWGNWLPWACWAVLVLGCILPSRRRVE